MAGLRKDCVYLGVKGQVVAIDSGTGKELWRTKLKGGDFVTAPTPSAPPRLAATVAIYLGLDLDRWYPVAVISRWAVWVQIWVH